ncbi:SdiA-regulated domain-containing protein [Winogradskyella marincola]|uniref:SdiA-regulated domain-containing protein n=1 Tax=Winogradskyella marincola TaxID=3037795 RepID=A0ABT6G3Y2_9FLAO|nr:SdiA-regulated domain-containing protein [Winogradskyella sp. YYF002]MDG4716758.1 SdiA-regulated domain-containing protein [Winogradskyella sp. YYF002]
MIHYKRLILITLIAVSCQSAGQLKIEGSINNAIKEASAAETTSQSNLIWTIEDAGNDSNLYGLDSGGNIVKQINITNASNIDWEDLTSDKEGNIYIGDFGNNNEKRKHFRILKINHNDLDNDTAEAEIIDFTVPKKKYSKDFEAFFLYNNSFYIFSKETKKFITLKVPNTPGKHEAILRSDFNLNGKNNKITSADISDDGKSIVLLNHDKVWKITDFSNDDFFSGNVEAQALDHNTQKEGICFKNDSTIYITDERNGDEGGNIYSYRLN